MYISERIASSWLPFFGSFQSLNVSIAPGPGVDGQQLLSVNAGTGASQIGIFSAIRRRPSDGTDLCTTQSQHTTMYSELWASSCHRIQVDSPEHSSIWQEYFISKRRAWIKLNAGHLTKLHAPLCHLNSNNTGRQFRAEHFFFASAPFHCKQEPCRCLHIPFNLHKLRGRTCPGCMKRPLCCC